MTQKKNNAALMGFAAGAGAGLSLAVLLHPKYRHLIAQQTQQVWGRLEPELRKVYQDAQNNLKSRSKTGPSQEQNPIIEFNDAQDWSQQ